MNDNDLGFLLVKFLLGFLDMILSYLKATPTTVDAGYIGMTVMLVFLGTLLGGSGATATLYIITILPYLSQWRDQS